MLLAPVDAPVYVVDATLLHEITGFDLHRGAIAAGDRRPATTLAELVRSARRLVVLEGLNDPENLGAVARSARAFGFDGLVLDPTCLDPYTAPHRARQHGRDPAPALDAASRPTTGRAPRSTQLADGGFETWALTPGPDSTDIWTLSVPDRLAIALGAEGPGLSDAIAARRRTARAHSDPWRCRLAQRGCGGSGGVRRGVAPMTCAMLTR